jgi:low affinity Fe/Cu permease
LPVKEREVQVPRDPHRAGFDRFAERAAGFVSRGFFFTACLLMVIIWVPSVLFFKSVDTWQLVISTITSVSAFLLIALLQNSERRYDEALHAKIDAMAAALADVIEYQEHRDPEQLRRHTDDLRAAVGLEREL